MSRGLSVRIRPATRIDIPGIVDVTLSSVSDEELVGFGGPNAESPYRDVARLSAAWHDPNRVDSVDIFVAETEGRVVGVVTVEDRGPELELVDIDVTRPHQGQGIGTRLVDFVERAARASGKSTVTLGTSRNARGVPWKSLPWWLARGYTVTGEEENDWTRSIGPGTREIRMRKGLAQKTNPM